MYHFQHEDFILQPGQTLRRRAVGIQDGNGGNYHIYFK